MKKTFLSALLLVCGLQFASAQSIIISNAERENLKGNVKCVKEFDIKEIRFMERDTIEKYKSLNLPLPKYERKFSKSKEYDMKGRLTLEKSLLWDQIYEDAYYYPENQEICLSTRMVSYTDGKLTRDYQIELDEEGFPSNSVAIDEKGDTIFTEINTKELLPQGKIRLITRKYLRDGGITEEEVVFNKNRAMESIKTSSVTNGDMEITLDDRERPLTLKRSSLYGGVIEEMEYGDKEKKNYVREEDSERWLRAKTLTDDNGNDIHLYVYDGNGDMNAEEIITYVYDTHGNWTRREVKRKEKEWYSDDYSESESIMEREIEYY